MVSPNSHLTGTLYTMAKLGVSFSSLLASVLLTGFTARANLVARDLHVQNKFLQPDGFNRSYVDLHSISL